MEKLIYVFRIWKGGNLDTHDVGSLGDIERNNIEADSFWTLSKLLDGIQDNYTFAQPGIQNKVRQLKELIERVDGELQNLFDPLFCIYYLCCCIFFLNSWLASAPEQAWSGLLAVFIPLDEQSVDARIAVAVHGAPLGYVLGSDARLCRLPLVRLRRIPAQVEGGAVASDGFSGAYVANLVIGQPVELLCYEHMLKCKRAHTAVRLCRDFLWCFKICQRSRGLTKRLANWLPRLISCTTCSQARQITCKVLPNHDRHARKTNGKSNRYEEQSSWLRQALATVLICCSFADSSACITQVAQSLNITPVHTLHLSPNQSTSISRSVNIQFLVSPLFHLPDSLIFFFIKYQFCVRLNGLVNNNRTF